MELGKNTNIKLETLINLCTILEKTPNEILGVPNNLKFNENNYFQLIQELNSLPKNKQKIVTELITNLLAELT